MLIWGTEKENLSPIGRKKDRKGIVEWWWGKEWFDKELSITGSQTLMLVLHLEWISVNRRPSRSRWTWVAPLGKAGIVSLSYHFWLGSKVHASFLCPLSPHHEDMMNNSLQIVNVRKIQWECGVASQKTINGLFCVFSSCSWVLKIIPRHDHCKNNLHSRLPGYPRRHYEEL